MDLGPNLRHGTNLSLGMENKKIMNLQIKCQQIKARFESYHKYLDQPDDNKEQGLKGHFLYCCKFIS